jgi:hypothetical protein
VLTQKDFNKLQGLLQNANMDSLKFPNITCCDGVITTIIVYYNGKRKYFKSMTPPTEANNLIKYLKSVGENKKLERTNVTKNIEN